MLGNVLRTALCAGVVVLLAIPATGCGDTTATTSVPPSTASPATTAGSTTAGFTTVAPSATAPASTAPANSVSTDAATAEGATLFADNCAACHGSRGEGGTGPDLRPFAPGDASLAAAITDTINGGGGDMPAFSGRFDSGQMSALVAYVLGL